MKSTKTLKKLSFYVTPDHHNYLILKYLKKLQPSWTKVFAIKMIRCKNVKVNGEKTTINYRLKQGDNIEIYGSDPNQNPEEIPLNLQRLKKLNVVFENENLIIVDKEAKMAVQSDEKHSFNNMNNRLLNHMNYVPNPQTWKPTFVHRLDYNTTGLLIGAKNYLAHQNITEAMISGLVEKHYRALVHGIVKFKNKTIKCYLLKRDNRVEVVDKTVPGSRESITEVTLVKHLFDENSSLLSMKLITGRTHQIRAHMALVGHPIRGDQKYGVEKEKGRYPYPALCAYKLIFSKNLPGETLGDLEGRIFEKEDIWFIP